MDCVSFNQSYYFVKNKYLFDTTGPNTAELTIIFNDSACSHYPEDVHVHVLKIGALFGFSCVRYHKTEEIEILSLFWKCSSCVSAYPYIVLNIWRILLLLVFKPKQTYVFCVCGQVLQQQLLLLVLTDSEF